MKPTLAVLAIVLSGAIVSAHAQSLPPQDNLRRLEDIHFDIVNQSIEWKVSRGSVNEDGDFVSTSKARYSFNLQTGLANHDGEEGTMSLGAFDGASRMFHALTLLMQSYTDRLDGTAHLERPDASDDVDPSDSVDERGIIPLHRIAAQLPIRHRRTLAPVWVEKRLNGSSGSCSAYNPSAGTDPGCREW